MTRLEPSRRVRFDDEADVGLVDAWWTRSVVAVVAGVVLRGWVNGTRWGQPGLMQCICFSEMCALPEGPSPRSRRTSDDVRSRKPSRWGSLRSCTRKFNIHTRAGVAEPFAM